MARKKPPRTVWLFQIPVVLVFTLLFVIAHCGQEGELRNSALLALSKKFESMAGWATDAKFRLRGSRDAGAKIVIVEIDEEALKQVGRWPWHRDAIAAVIQAALDAGARVVGLDMVFAEPDPRVPEALAETIREKGLTELVNELPGFETDPVLQRVITINRDRIVLGWQSDNGCVPATGECDEASPLPKGFEKFAYAKVTGPVDQATSVFSTPRITANLDEYNGGAAHSAYYMGWPDSDLINRRSYVAVTAGGHMFPSLGMAMARVGLDDPLEITLDDDGEIEQITFQRSGRTVPVSAQGALAIDFLGPGYHAGPFAWVPVMQLVEDGPIKFVRSGQVETAPLTDVFKDAYVFFAVSALGANDIRDFPFDTHGPGVEGHATVLENLLSDRMLRTGAGWCDWRLVLVLMSLGALLFAYGMQRLEAVPAIGLLVVVFAVLVIIDVYVLFSRSQINLNTVLLYTELMTLFLVTLSVKYVLEERSKKFIRGAFSKYLAPSVINAMLEDPSKLKVGGEKKELSILFSDIRSFSTFSEKMDAPTLAAFLNEYLSAMTEIVFEEGGTLDKYIGDAVMAFWGAPIDDPTHAARSCRAAQRMMQKLADQRAHFKEVYGIDVEVGVGINSGPVNVGNMGSDRIFEFTVIGDHVNLASRLEGLTKYYRASIITTRFTVDAIEKAGAPLPELRVLDEVKVKGKKVAVEILQVLDKPMSKEGLDAFEAARQHYRVKRWDEAVLGFQEASKLLDGDGPSEMYIERIAEFRTQASDDWDGSWEMTSK